MPLISGVEYIKCELEKYEERTERLRNMDLFVLDNSMRETTVGQLRGHTLEDKYAIYEEVSVLVRELYIILNQILSLYVQFEDSIGKNAPFS